MFQSSSVLGRKRQEGGAGEAGQLQGAGGSNTYPGILFITL